MDLKTSETFISVKERRMRSRYLLFACDGLDFHMTRTDSYQRYFSDR